MTLEERIQQMLEEVNKTEIETEIETEVVEESEESEDTLTEISIGLAARAAKASSDPDYEGNADHHNIVDLAKKKFGTKVGDQIAGTAGSHYPKKYGSSGAEVEYERDKLGGREMRSTNPSMTTKADKLTKNAQRGLKTQLKQANEEFVEDVAEETVETKPEVAKQVAALLEAEGLSEEFKLQAVTIFEAAVTDRVMQIEESLNEKFEERVAEAEAKFESDKAELATKIDGFLNESAQKWATDNEVAIKTGFRVKLAESFMDGLAALLKEHNVTLAEESEDALQVALDRVSELESTVSEEVAKTAAVTEQLNAVKAAAVLESYRDKMTATAFDRFVQLTESVKFSEQGQYETQLRIVFENFGSDQAPIVESLTKTETVEVIAEEAIEESTVSVDPMVAAYAAAMVR